MARVSARDSRLSRLVFAPSSILIGVFGSFDGLERGPVTVLLRRLGVAAGVGEIIKHAHLNGCG